MDGQQQHDNEEAAAIEAALQQEYRGEGTEFPCGVQTAPATIPGWML